MATTPCRDCGHIVSTWAELCPRCGRKYPGSKPREQAMVLGGVLFLLIALSFVILMEAF